MEKTNLFKKKHGILLDTETILKDGQKLIYDIAWLVIDNQGNIIRKRNRLTDIFLDDFALMFNSQFVTYEKYQKYQQMKNEMTVGYGDWWYTMELLDRDIKDYNVSFITAYNLNFDLNAIANTCEYLTTLNPLETRADSLIFLDLWKLSQSHIATRSYQKHCQVHGWLTEKRRQPKTTAETIYRWISKDNDFIESHTALADCEIEIAIYRKCKQKKKRIPENAYLTY